MESQITEAATPEVTLRSLLFAQLGRLRDGEMHLLEELPRMLPKIDSPVLMRNVSDWFHEIGENKLQLEALGSEMGAERLEGVSLAVRSSIQEGMGHIGKLPKGRPCDSAIAGHSIRHLEHQLSGYAAAAAYAAELGEKTCSEKLQKIQTAKLERLKKLQRQKGNNVLHYESFPFSNGVTFWRPDANTATFR